MNSLSKKYVALGMAFIFLTVGGIFLVYKLFRGDFASTSPLLVDAPRAGLLMDPGAEVKLRGVQIGKVSQVRSIGSGAQLVLAIDPNYMSLISTNVQVQIVPPTAFGAKYVALTPSVDPSSPVSAGSTIDASHVTIEVNQAFEHLMGVLAAAQPAAVNDALNSIAGAFQGNGATIGRLIDSSDAYLRKLNPALPAFTNDAQMASKVLALYAQLAPKALDTANNVSTTTQTLVAQDKTLQKLLGSFGAAADAFNGLLRTNGQQLVDAMNLLDPFTALLQEYSPELSCTLKGLQYFNTISRPVMGGNQPGIASTTRFHLSQDPYTYAANLPVVRANNAPSCYGLPELSHANAHMSHAVVDTGADPYVNPTNTRQVNPNALLLTLLGVN